MSHVQKCAVAAEAGVALGTVSRYLTGKKMLRVSGAAIEAALRRLGWQSFIRPSSEQP